MLENKSNSKGQFYKGDFFFKDRKCKKKLFWQNFRKDDGIKKQEFFKTLCNKISYETSMNESFWGKNGFREGIIHRRPHTSCG